MVLAFCHFFLQNRPTIAAGLVGTGSSILQFLTRREYYDFFKRASGGCQWGLVFGAPLS